MGTFPILTPVLSFSKAIQKHIKTTEQDTALPRPQEYPLCSYKYF